METHSTLKYIEESCFVETKRETKEHTVENFEKPAKNQTSLNIIFKSSAKIEDYIRGS